MANTLIPGDDGYATTLAAMPDLVFFEECFNVIDAANQSAFYSHNDNMARMCWAESERRERPDLYKRAFDAAFYKAKGDEMYRGTIALLEMGAD